MHNIPMKEGESITWTKRQILEDLRFRLNRAEREVIRLDMLAQLPNGTIESIHTGVSDDRLTELLAEIAATYAAHFVAPTAAFVQRDTHKTTGEAA